MTKLMGMGCLWTLQEHDMQETGKMTCNMVMEKKFGTMEALSIQVSSSEGRRMARVAFSGRMVLTSKETLWMDSSQGSESTTSQT